MLTKCLYQSISLLCYVCIRTPTEKDKADNPLPKQRDRWGEGEKEKLLKCGHEVWAVNGDGVQGVICRG